MIYVMLTKRDDWDMEPVIVKYYITKPLIFMPTDWR
jgi:hypothetical protein